MPEASPKLTHPHHGRPGVLLINLGTPDAPETPEVRRYLRQFLSDPRVLDINPVGRAALLNLIILPTRPAKSAEAYREVWTDMGSPLLFHGEALAKEIAQHIPEAVVVLAMRYGNPSIAAGLAQLQKAGCDEIVVFPLFPQYASSSTGSAVEAIYAEASKLWNTPFLRIVPPFYDDPEFIESFAEVARPVLDEMQPDHVLFSYHGLPERHVTKSDATGQHCLKTPDCCESIGFANRQCYGAHCHATTAAIQSALELNPTHVSAAYQSRLGRTPWLRPYTDFEVVELAKRGVKKLAVFCPSFVADCLETIEEIGIRAEEDFKKAGGEELRLIPSLNSSERWVRGATKIVRRHLPVR
ncbi:Ferrochelatase [Planctomycetes bacterium Poly30]|uniref:Ferrochelatase n=1 Tax=Saltatorellus ferox TaxID=2528018 RepID=A0A518ENB5_9BACT|nr:Ferrochelatase [Planctomycetes bacterium Poly30]